MSAMSACVPDLVRRLDEAVDRIENGHCCGAVKAVLEDVFRAGGAAYLAPEMMRPNPERYARHLVHRDPAGRYTAVAMVWSQGQGTLLHDHAGKWCVECVVRGRIQVVSYQILNDEAADVVRFQPERQIMAGVGEAGALIPPFEHHTIENVDPDPAVTLHVYAEELDWCHVFVPVEGGYRRERRDLVYTS